MRDMCWVLVAAAPVNDLREMISVCVLHGGDMRVKSEY